MTLADVKAFLKVDGTDDDANLTALMQAAEAHIRGAVNSYDTFYQKDADFTALADMVQKLIILELYDMPLPAEGGAGEYSFPIRTMLAQLQYWKAAG